MIKLAARLIFSVNPDDELKRYQALIIFQIFSILFLLLGGLVVYLTEIFNPNFFNYQYFILSVDSSNLLRFWPLFLYAGVMAYVSSIKLSSSRLDRQILGWSVLTSILAGIWEELGYRWLYICTAMLLIVVINWAFATFLGIIFGIIIIFLGIAILMAGKSDRKLGKMIGGVLMLIGGIGMIWIFYQSDPLFWLYQNIVVPIVNFVTMGFFANIFYNPEYPKLFIWGMVSANANFRDGHKYQGPVGWLNSWIVGFILMSAMLNYGLGTAIAIHIIYDIEFSAIHYIFRKVDWI